MDIYDRIDLKLQEKKTSRRKMCNDLDIPYSTLTSFYLSRSGNMTLSTIQKIARYLDTTMDYLVNGEEEKIDFIPNDSHPKVILTGDQNNQRELSELEIELVKVVISLPTKKKIKLLSEAYKIQAEGE